MGRPKTDLTGQVFGQLTVIAASEPKAGCSMWKCKCTCGTIKAVRSFDLRSGHATSCGCYQVLAARRSATLRHRKRNRPRGRAIVFFDDDRTF